jgi:ribosomal protein S2
MEDVPEDYLEWMLTNGVQTRYHKAIKKLLKDSVPKTASSEGLSQFKARKKLERDQDGLEELSRIVGTEIVI